MLNLNLSSYDSSDSKAKTVFFFSFAEELESITIIIRLLFICQSARRVQLV